jgi:hypothetical protein
MFFANVWVPFGFPTSIISYRDSHFLGKFWSHLWDLMGTKINKSTNFHPQIDGQIKVVNIKMVHLLQGYCTKCPKLWDEKLPYVLLDY